MKWKDTLIKKLGGINPRLLAFAEKKLKVLPGVNQEIEKEYDEMMAALEGSVKPYKDKFTSFTQIPEVGRARTAILHEMEAMRAYEEAQWKDGFVSGAVYHGDQEHIDFLNRVYALNSQSNPLHSDVWPSATKFDGTIAMMSPAPRRACGQKSSLNEASGVRKLFQ